VPRPPLFTYGARKTARRLGLFDTTMIVMGGIIGSGILRNLVKWPGVCLPPDLFLQRAQD